MHFRTKSNSVLSGADSKEPAPAPSPADSGVAELERDHHDYRYISLLHFLTYTKFNSTDVIIKSALKQLFVDRA